MTKLERVRDYYGTFDEWARLESPAGRLEFEQALALLHEYLPQNSSVLDLGGGPGRYTIALARRGHRVWLADLSVRQLEEARVRIVEAGVGDAVESVDEVNAMDLTVYGDAMFDAVLAFGPIYHLVQEDERDQAAREMARVLRPDGLMFATFIPKASGLAGLIQRAAAAPEQVPAAAFCSTVRTGVFRNATRQGFQEGYFPELGEVKDLFAAAGFSCEEVLSLRGIAFGREEELHRIQETQPDLYAQVCSTLRELRRDPSVIGLGGHAVYIGRR